MKLDFTLRASAVSYKLQSTTNPGYTSGTAYPTIEAAIRAWQATSDHDAKYVRVYFTDS